VNSVEEKYRILFYKVIDNLINHLSTRFSSIEKMEFFSLLNCEKFDIYRFKATFPEQLIKKLVQVYDGIFDCALLKNEVLYGSEEFKGKSHYDILQWFHMNRMATMFKETYKLANLISTIPATTASVERSLSAFKRIKIYLRSTEGQEGLSHLSLLSIEKVLLADLKKKPNFYDQVIEKIVAVDMRAELHFK
jgi:hypothetical protein